MDAEGMGPGPHAVPHMQVPVAPRASLERTVTKWLSPSFSHASPMPGRSRQEVPKGEEGAKLGNWAEFLHKAPFLVMWGAEHRRQEVGRECSCCS